MPTLNFFIHILGCATEPEKAEDKSGVILVDNDGDGYFSDEDCNDLESSIYPETIEVCDGIDNNCDGVVDEDVTTLFYADSDEDGFGNPDIFIESCDLPNGYVDNGSDCDDAQSQTYPAAVEVCDDEDNNCDGVIDEGLEQDFFVDSDEDGIGGAEVFSACILTQGISSISGDCDDTDPNVHPLIPEIVMVKITIVMVLPMKVF